ncbi:MAG: hypothetical protein LBQ97_08180 [Fusobacteriaceae bacterium]|jgi:hypothetical protein|nr:hypothetical protein [Fusobacteriaceae bacterium]
MKKVILAFTVLLSLCGPGQAKKESFHVPFYSNSNAKFTFRIPPGWEEIPPATIRQINASMQSLTGAKGPGIATGFRKTSENPPQAMVTVNIIKGRVVWKDFLKDYGNMDKITKEMKKDFSTLESANVGTPVVDDKRKMVLFPASYEFKNKAKASGTVLAACGSGTLVTIYFPGKDGADPDVEAFKKTVFASFTFSKGYEYGARTTGNPLSRPVVCGIIGGLVALLVTSRKKAKEEKKKKAAK